MKNEKEIRAEIEILRKKLNEKIASNDKCMTDSDTLKLSKKMDKLLNQLNEITIK